MSNGSQVRVGIIGTGVGIRTLVPGFRSTGKAEIIGIVGSSPKRAQECAAKVGIPRAFDDYKQLIDCKDIDLICVASPNKYHYEEAAYAIRAGKHLLVEKPLALSSKETAKLAHSVEGYRRMAVVDHQLRFNPYIQEIKRQIQTGRIGAPYFIRIHQQGTGFSRRDATWNWSFDEKEGGGVLLAMGSHLLDLLWYWLGKAKVYSVDCTIDPVVTERADDLGRMRNVRASSFFAASLSLGGGCTAHLSATAAALGESRFDIDVFGSDGELHFDLAGKLKASYLENVGKIQAVEVSGVTEEEQRNTVSIFKGSFVYFAPAIVEAIVSGDLSNVADGCTFLDAVRTQEVLDALSKAALGGSSVQIDKGYITRAAI